MSENQEIEITRLEFFRSEIKKFVEKFGGKDATAALIKDVKELDAQDMALWDDFKRILIIVDNLDAEEDKNILKTRIDKIADLTKRLMDDAYDCIKKGKEESKESKISFAALINNKNPRIIATEAADTARKKRNVVAAARELQTFLKNAIEFYAKDGWKNSEDKI